MHIVDTLEILIKDTLEKKCEGQRLEIKAAKEGSPKCYDTFSSFANQSDGGIILYGINKDSDYELCGVYDAQNLQKDLVNQSKEMEPSLDIVFKDIVYNGKVIVAAFIEGKPLGERPVYRRTAGIMQGSYTRVGDADMHMTPAQLYDIDSYKKSIRPDLSVVMEFDTSILDEIKVEDYISNIKHHNSMLGKRGNSEILELRNIVRSGHPTIAGIMCLGDYPQRAYPGCCATCVAYRDFSEESDIRFRDSLRIEGTITEMLEETALFIRRNTRNSIAVTGSAKNKKISEYPEIAIREMLVNAFMHRDYGPFSNGTPIRISLFEDRIECVNPGGLYGGATIEELGHVNLQTRNPALATLLEDLGVAEHRHSGIPTMRVSMQSSGLPEPVFTSDRDEFKVTLFNSVSALDEHKPDLRSSRKRARFSDLGSVRDLILEFCSIPRTRNEIADYIKRSSVYTATAFIKPMVEDGLLNLTMPDKPRSKYQKYIKA